MTSDDRVSREVALLVSLIAQKASRVSLDRVEDVGLLLLEMAAPSRMTEQRPSPTRTGLRTGVAVFRRARGVLPPLVARLTFASTYVAARAGLFVVRGVSRALQAMP